jgi:putative transposase
MNQLSLNNPPPSYFCTDTIMGWQYVFTDVPFFHAIVESLDFCRREKGLRVHGYVIMPNHVHLILSSDGAALSSILRDYKRYTSRRLSILLEENRNTRLLEYFHKVAALTPRGTDYTIWQRGSSPMEITSMRFFLEKLYRLHDNPVRKGYVQRPEHWKYSSARNYILDDDSILYVDKMF